MSEEKFITVRARCQEDDEKAAIIERYWNSYLSDPGVRAGILIKALAEQMRRQQVIFDDQPISMDNFIVEKA